MRIIEEYDSTEIKVISINSVDNLGDFVLRINFNDGASQLVNFKLFLKNSHHPSIRKYLNDTFFKQYEIVYGNLNWNDYEMCFPIWDLYTGNIY
ncbi:MAG: DUF2442 domain-containing protein [Candidatus Kapabacteria bacterium]|nr:DUF2442 domain-containing protein [Candidatus Kapabacteria bacterium]